MVLLYFVNLTLNEFITLLKKPVFIYATMFYYQLKITLKIQTKFQIKKILKDIIIMIINNIINLKILIIRILIKTIIIRKKKKILLTLALENKDLRKRTIINKIMKMMKMRIQ
jgi:hypothetical protein